MELLRREKERRHEGIENPLQFAFQAKQQQCNYFAKIVRIHEGVENQFSVYIPAKS